MARRKSGTLPKPRISGSLKTASDGVQLPVWRVSAKSAANQTSATDKRVPSRLVAADTCLCALPAVSTSLLSV